MQHTIEALVAPVFGELVQMIESFTPENFNKIPFEGSWTAGQTVQHIRLSCGNIVHLLHSATVETQEDPEAKLVGIRDLFMDFGTKFQAPEFIVPEFKEYTQQPFIDFFKNLEKELSLAMENLDLTETCLDFEFPGFGNLTRVEWLGFTVYHTQRHIHQLRTISQKL